MKHTILKFFAIIFLLTHLSCKKDKGIVNNENFSVQIKQNINLPISVTSKDNIVFDITITSEVPIKDAVINLDKSELYAASSSTNSNQINLQYTYQADVKNVGKSLIFRLIVTDYEGRIVIKDFVVYIEVPPANILINIPANAPIEIKDNESVNFDINVVSENDIKYIKTFVDQREITSLTKEVFTNPKVDNYAFNYLPSIADAGKTLSFTIEVMDILGNIFKKIYPLSIKRSQAVDFNTYSNVNLGAQRSTDAGPFFSSSKGEVYFPLGSSLKSADIDLVNFFSGSSRAFNLVSPTLSTVANSIYTIPLFGIDALESWPTRNLTMIKKVNISQTEFDSIASAAEIEAIYISSSIVASESSGGLANGNVIVFRTASGKYGALYVKSRSANANTGYLTVDIKVQR